MSQTVDEECVTLTNDGYIELDGETVGFVGWQGNTLVDIMVDKPQRNQGVATIAVQKMIEQMCENNPDIQTIKTTVVVSNSMKRVLSKVGFEQFVVEKKAFSPDEIPEHISEEKIPVEEKIKFEYSVS